MSSASIRSSSAFLSGVLLAGALLGAFASAQVSLVPVADAAIYSESGTSANGSGSYLFAGQNAAGNNRRSLLRFDVAALVPAGASITSVTLQLNCNQASSASDPASVHRVLAHWSEGASDPTGAEGAGTSAVPGDVTWTERVFAAAQPWLVPGGEFDAAASASTIALGPGPVVFASTSALVADVQSWLDQPATNHGWILRGNEGAPSSARRFDSRHGATPSLWPALVVGYTTGCVSPANFCVVSPNSAGAGATIGSLGSTSLAQNNFSLTASGCPAATHGLFYFGSQPTQTLFGNGARCVTGTLHRLGVQTTSAGGDALRVVDLTSGPGSHITAGSTWYFQFWFRDVAGGGAGFNLSNGLDATFCP